MTSLPSPLEISRIKRGYLNFLSINLITDILILLAAIWKQLLPYLSLFSVESYINIYIHYNLITLLLSIRYFTTPISPKWQALWSAF